ncbi:MAG: hypothetical protein ACI4XG_28515, partial [Bradyrhizobium sp.]
GVSEFPQAAGIGIRKGRQPNTTRPASRHCEEVARGSLSLAKESPGLTASPPNPACQPHLGLAGARLPAIFATAEAPCGRFDFSDALADTGVMRKRSTHFNGCLKIG